MSSCSITVAIKLVIDHQRKAFNVKGFPWMILQSMRMQACMSNNIVNIGIYNRKWKYLNTGVSVFEDSVRGKKINERIGTANLREITQRQPEGRKK
ncbi:hypothetical protein AVEN_11175-1 [Araneus ventricosus]|uniref:Uncharacterized protein n=1 Tax=Araneus ventricosus TaxID=182803 RepID=A0A4Y2TB86_ARAVE|nr:hypothetical protein AVEN_11175-1 [Araneus ventricosus]